MRNFSTGATRDSDENKYDYEGFLSPLVLEHYAAYMHSHRKQADGNLRDSDNWQKGIPKEAYMKSMFRHFMDVWKEHRGIDSPAGMEENLNALLFNVMGYLHEYIKELSTRYTVTEPGKERLSVMLSNLPKSVLDIDKEMVATYDDPADAYLADFSGYTHRYGALAHDQESIDAEEDDEERRRQTAYKSDEIEIGQSAYPAAYNVSSLERGEVLGISPERTPGEVATVAAPLRNLEDGSTPVCACIGSKWESSR